MMNSISTPSCTTIGLILEIQIKGKNTYSIHQMAIQEDPLNVEAFESASMFSQ